MRISAKRAAIVLLPIALAACAGIDDGRSIDYTADGSGAHQPNPASYRPQLLAFMKTYLNNPVGVVDTTGSMPFQCIVQPGINKIGNRPNGDVAYISDATAGDISDFAHQTLASAMGVTFSGIIRGVVHQSLIRKDDTGSRQAKQVCLSSGVEADGTAISLGNNYTYYQQILEADPNTGTLWTEAGFNASTWGVEEVT